MKKLKMLAIAFLIGGLSVFASEKSSTDPVTPAAVLKAQIIELLPAGFFGNLEEAEVKIHFTYGSKGEIIVLRINSKNKWVRKYIEKNLNQKIVDAPGEVGRVYDILLKIKPER